MCQQLAYCVFTVIVIIVVVVVVVIVIVGSIFDFSFYEF